MKWDQSRWTRCITLGDNRQGLLPLLLDAFCLFVNLLMRVIACPAEGLGFNGTSWVFEVAPNTGGLICLLIGTMKYDESR